MGQWRIPVVSTGFHRFLLIVRIAVRIIIESAVARGVSLKKMRSLLREETSTQR
jgi:hypothetical protein